MKIAVIGLGKIGLPLAVQFADKGHEVTAVDINAETVATVNAGREPFPGEARLAENLARLVSAGNLNATLSYAEAIPTADAVVVLVPLFVDVDGAPDFDWLDAATRDIADNLTRDTLIIYETTLPVGTTRDRWKPMLEQRSGLTEGAQFHVVFSPERVLSGRIFDDLRKYPKLVGGLTTSGTAQGIQFYEQVLDFDERPDLVRGNGVWDLGTAEAAEMAKLAETTYRDVNIALANQFAVFAERAGIDIFQVIDASNSQPFSHIHRPGISVGGHCIPVYPHLYLYNDRDASIVFSARETNAGMPSHVVSILEREYGNLTDANVAVLGASYRGGVKETAFSGVFPTVETLKTRDARATVQDPLYNDAELRKLGFEPYHFGTAVDAVIIHTEHAEYGDLSADDLPGVTVIVDGRNLLEPTRFPGVTIRQIGRGQSPRNQERPF